MFDNMDLTGQFLCDVFAMSEARYSTLSWLTIAERIQSRVGNIDILFLLSVEKASGEGGREW